jgi:hypothetical protein
MRLILLIAAATVFVGCRTHSKRTVDQFAFLEIGTPMTVVSNRVGMPDLPYRGQIRWRYSLADGSEMVIIAESEKEPYTFETWRVVFFGQWRGDVALGKASRGVAMSMPPNNRCSQGRGALVVPLRGSRPLARRG